MSADEMHSVYDTILILDFGSQVGYTARRVTNGRCKADLLVLPSHHTEMSRDQCTS